MEKLYALNLSESYTKEFVGGAVAGQIGGAIGKLMAGSPSGIVDNIMSPSVYVGPGLTFIITHALVNLVYGDSVVVPLLFSLSSGYFSAVGSYSMPSASVMTSMATGNPSQV